MNKFQLYYYKTISAILPNVLLILVLWTCYDIFLSSILMIMIFYMMITLYYFQISDRDLNITITANIEELVYSENKKMLLVTGYFYNSICLIPSLLIILSFTDLPIYLPIPNNTQALFLLVYLGFVVLLFCFGLQIINEIFYKIFALHKIYL